MLNDYGCMAKIVLMGISELRVRFGGVSRQRADQLTRRADFPNPLADLAQGRIWLGADVERWLKQRKTRRSKG